MMPLHLPRRFRRRLLLPPGWVASGFLLLLGCLLLRAHWRQLRPVNVVQLTVPPLKLDTTGLTAYMHSIYPDDVQYDTPYKSPTELNRLRPWHTIELGGWPFKDFFAAQELETAVRAINADSSHAGGVRVLFQRGATYGSLVKALDIMLITKHKKYWPDLRHQPLTLYAVTNKELPKIRQLTPYFVCGTSYCESHLLPPQVSFWQRWLAAYWQPAWRLPMMLVVVIGCLSVYRLTGALKNWPRQPKP